MRTNLAEQLPDTTLRVAFTEAHGMALELAQFPPDGVQYSFVKPLPVRNRFLRSAIKGYFGHYQSERHDLIEAVLSPIFTRDNWIYSLANFHEALAFNVLGCPLPRSVRTAYIRELLLRDNFKKLIFWSEAGKNTMKTYPGIGEIEQKATVVYPAIRGVPDQLIRFNKERVRLLFTGDFFRKGGVNVLDAFERAQASYPEIELILCCDREIDFNTRNSRIKEDCLRRIGNNPGIRSLGRVDRDLLLNGILPDTDIYLLPTYTEAFGFAILEAMAYGIPVISTNFFAIPEIVADGRCGFLIDTSRFDCEQLFRGYVVDEIPDDFRNHVSDSLFRHLCRLIESPALREEFGRAGVEIARSKFSFATRNEAMLQVYREATA